MWFETWHRGSHLGYRIRHNLASLNLYVAPVPPIKFQFNPTYGLGGDIFEDFQEDQHGGHRGYQKEMILAILNLHVTPVPPTKFGFSLT